MGIIDVYSYALGEWVPPPADARTILGAVDGEPVARAGSGGLDFAAMAAHAREVGGPALRALTFHERAHRLKALAAYLNEQREALYELSYLTGATRADGAIDIDGGISTLFVYSSKGRREMPDGTVYRDGALEMLSREGNFVGQHVATPLPGVAVHINAFNFPVWGMLEKLAPTLLAGMPAIVKPASATGYLSEACFRMMIDSGIFPDGAIQLVAGGAGDLLDHLGFQDVVSFTGSAATAGKLRRHAAIADNSVRLVAEQDSLNASVLGPDGEQGSPEFDALVREATKEMTVKAGQKCTAIRRILVPRGRVEPLIEALGAKLAATTIGDPRLDGVRMGALVSQAQREDVLAVAGRIGEEAERVFGDEGDFAVEGADRDKGAFLPPMLYCCADPDGASHVHELEAFGPVATVMGYRDVDHAIELVNRGKGGLVASVFTNDGEVARRFVHGAGPFHGRLYFANRATGKAATGHGSPLPHMVHGGPGRAGGGEELGGVRGVLHYMQRTAIQADPDLMSAITGTWVHGSKTQTDGPHPFRLKFGELTIGKTFNSQPRQITLEDIEHFADFTGDTFYAHMDEEAAAANPFFPGRVAHGYLLLSFAAGLFVDPDPGPVLANYGLDNLRFLKPVSPGETIRVRLTVCEKTGRTDEHGEVRWDVELFNGEDEPVARYELLTMNAR